MRWALVAAGGSISIWLSFGVGAPPVDGLAPSTMPAALGRSVVQAVQAVPLPSLRGARDPEPLPPAAKPRRPISGGTTPTRPVSAARPTPSEPELAPRPRPQPIATPPATTRAPGPEFVSVIDGSCRGCAVVQRAGGAIRATVGGADSGTGTAYALLDFGGPGGIGGPVSARDRIGLGAQQSPSADLRVLQVMDVSNRVVYRLTVSAADRVLRIDSPPGGLSSNAIDVSTGAVVPNDGRSGLLVEITAQANNSVVVRVDGSTAVSLTGLTGGDARQQRFLAAGVVSSASPDPGRAASPVTVSHDALTVTAGSQGQGPGTRGRAASPTPGLAPAAPRSRVAPTALAPPSLSGPAVAGATLRADPGLWSDGGSAVRIGWERCAADGTGCAAISGADGPAYVLGDADVGAVVRVHVTASNGSGTGTAVSAATTVVAVATPVSAVPVNLAVPSLDGDAVVGSTLTASSGEWADPAPTLSYAWQRCSADGTSCTPIDGATGLIYALVEDDLGAVLRVVVTGASESGLTEALSAPSAVVAPAPEAAPAAEPTAPTVVEPPSISGDAVVGGTSTAVTGTWSDASASISVEWERCDAGGEACAAIPGATGSTYVPTGDDVGSTLRIVVTATNAAGTGTSTSAASTAIGPAPEPPAVAPPAPAPPDAAAPEAAAAPAPALGPPELPTLPLEQPPA